LATAGLVFLFPAQSTATQILAHDTRPSGVIPPERNYKIEQKPQTPNVATWHVTTALAEIENAPGGDPALITALKSSAASAAHATLPSRKPELAPIGRTAAPAHTIENEQIALLVKRGEGFIASGDFVSARLLFQRAAEGGNARAAFMLARTYERDFLARSRVRGLVGDIGKARFWYEKAVELGSTEASAKLEMLTRRAD
jgi:hypothetical protein